MDIPLREFYTQLSAKRIVTLFSYAFLNSVVLTGWAQKSSFSYKSLYNDLNKNVDEYNDSLSNPAKSRGISMRLRDKNDELPKFNKNYGSNFNRLAKKDLSYVITGSSRGDLFSNNVALDVMNPSLTLALAYWIGSDRPGYKKVYNAANCEVAYVPRKKMPDLPFRIATTLEMYAGTKNNIATLFSTNNQAMNSDLRIKPSLTFVFHGNYKVANEACFQKLKNDALNREKAVTDAINLSKFIQKKFQKKIDSLYSVLNAFSQTATGSETDLDYAGELKAAIRELTIKRNSESDVEDELSYSLQDQVDEVIYNFPYKHRVYYWASLNGDWAWHEYARYNPSDYYGDAYIDKVRFMTYNFGPSFNLIYVGHSNSWASSFYINTKMLFGFTNNAVNADPISYTTYSEIDLNDSSTVYSYESGQAYNAHDFKTFWSMNWHLNFIWYIDPNRIFGINTYLDMTQKITGGFKPGVWTLGEGLVFSIPARLSYDRSVTNLTLFVQQVDLQKTAVTTTETGLSRQKWYNRIDVGLKVGVPFGIFGRR